MLYRTMAAETRVPIPQTHRTVWPDSTEIGPLATDRDAVLTAWLRPQRDGALDAERARQLGATPLPQRSYDDRAAFERRTGAAPDDVAALRAYCKRFGLAISDERWRSVEIAGPLDKLIHAFGATVSESETGGARFRHRAGSLHAPPEIASIVRGVFGLHQWPRSLKLGALERRSTPLRAGDVAKRYRFPDGDGRGQTIALLQLRGVFKPADFQQCMRAQKLAPEIPAVKRVDAAAVAHELSTTQDLEASLDVQIAASLAPGARLVVYEAPDDERGFLDAARDAIFDQQYAPDILSISYGWPEYLWTPAALAILEDLFAAAALLGVTVFCSAGDHGAELDREGRPHVLSPASSPFAIACGATTIDGAEERAWENGGGGFSERFGVPVWQHAVPASASRYKVTPGRGLPDVAAQEKPGYYVVMDGVELAMGGTSAVAPMWAALIARVNQGRGVRAGFFAPLLYAKRDGPLFTEITSGSNGRYHAAAGWNPCTGLGVPIGTAIENALCGPAR
ncbi:MAG TPA: S53 family peptidase [Candidatus Acidoferrales bacterium]|nr:S53 family peptidase [Candidatus Acidoferrales bacterium]